MHDAVRHSHCAVGVLVHRKEVTDTSFTKILFVYNGTPDEKRALKIMRQSNIPVTILAKPNTITKELPENITVIESLDPQKDSIEESKKKYNLIAVGSPRNSTDIYESHAVKNTYIPTLIIFPEKRKKGEKLKDDEDNYIFIT